VPEGHEALPNQDRQIASRDGLPGIEQVWPQSSRLRRRLVSEFESSLRVRRGARGNRFPKCERICRLWHRKTLSPLAFPGFFMDDVVLRHEEA
jgi:hypothetical protein